MPRAKIGFKCDDYDQCLTVDGVCVYRVVGGAKVRDAPSRSTMEVGGSTKFGYQHDPDHAEMAIAMAIIRIDIVRLHETTFKCPILSSSLPHVVFDEIRGTGCQGEAGKSV
jgi:hypothetical protein